jgi:hypothetical protein
MLSAIAGAVVFAAITAFSPDIADARDRMQISRSRPYFVDFRSRPGYVYGHTIVVYGYFDAQGRAVEERYAGLYPKDDEAGLIVGTIIPVDASVRPVKEDFNTSPSMVYRRELTAREYRIMRAAIRHERQREHFWHVVIFNCNDFAARIAQALDMRVPSTLLLPPFFVLTLRLMNGRHS